MKKSTKKIKTKPLRYGDKLRAKRRRLINVKDPLSEKARLILGRMK